MSLQTKLEMAKTIVQEHNDSLPSDLKETATLDWTKIHTEIIKAGGTSEANLRSLTWEDLTQCGLPKLLARRIANEVFRKQDDPSVPEVKFISETRAASMSPDQLLMHYDPEGERNPTVTKRLKELAGDKPFIVFDASGRVVVPFSTRLLKEIRTGQLPRAHVEYDGKQVRTFKVDERPSGYLPENPLYPGHGLREDQTCTITDRSWVKVPHRARQILKVAIKESGELKVGTKEDIHNVLDRFEGKTEPEILALVQTRYPKAALLLNEAEERGHSDPLKVARGASPIILPGQNDPFYGDGRRHTTT